MCFWFGVDTNVTSYAVPFHLISSLVEFIVKAANNDEKDERKMKVQIIFINSQQGKGKSIPKLKPSWVKNKILKV